MFQRNIGAVHASNQTEKVSRLNIHLLMILKTGVKSNGQ